MGFKYCLMKTLAAEKERITNKYFFVALALTVVIFTSAPPIIKFVFTLIDGWRECYKFFVLHFSCYAILQILMYNGMDWIMHKKIPYFEQYRIEKKPWPWEVDPKAWKETLKKVKVVKRKNGLIGVFMYTAISFYFQFWNTSLDAIPTSWEILWQTVLCMLWIDVWNYCVHTILHHPQVYQRVHKIHHEFTQVQSNAASYSHWLEYVFMGMVPSLIVPILLGKRMHLGTMCFWMLFRQAEAQEHHLGYEFPWVPFRFVPFSATAEFHSYHHSHNDGNLATYFTILDTIFQTNENYYRYHDSLEKQREQGHDSKSKVKAS